MISLVAAVLILLVPTLWVFVWLLKDSHSVIDAVLGSAVACMVSAIVATAFAFFFVHLEGLAPNYSSGERIGYITKASTKGLWFVTNEIDIQVGSGQLASLQPQHEFSVPDQSIYESLARHLGRKVRVEYKQWLVMPWRLGETDYEVTGVEYLHEDRAVGNSGGVGERE